MGRFIYNPIKIYKYDILQIIPDSRLNKNTYENIINAIYSTYNSFLKRIYKDEDEVLYYHKQQPISYEILFDGSKKTTTPNFYFSIPQYCSEYLKQRIQAIIPHSTLIFVDDYSRQFDNSYVCKYNYEKDSILSLNTKDNNFLEALLSIKNDLLKEEKILLQIQMTPLSDMWKGFHNDKWDKIRQGKDIITKTSLIIKIFDWIDSFIQEVFEILDKIMEYKDITKKDLEKKEKKLLLSNFSSASRQKINNDGFAVTIKNHVQCKDELKALAYNKSIEVAMRELEEDNRLIMSKIKKGNIERKYNPFELHKNIMSTKELASIVNLPNGLLQRRFNIKNIRIKQINAPKECFNGGIRIGTIKIYGETKNVFFPKDKNNFSRPNVLYSGMGAGKSTAILNMCCDAIDNNISVIMLDYIKNCEMGKNLAKLRPKTHVINLASNDINMYAGFPEIPILDTDTIEQRLNKANTISYEMKYLLNAMATDAEPMTRRMSKYLQSATRLVFCHKNATIQQVIDVLEFPDIRAKYIEKTINEGLMTENDRDIINLCDLDNETKTGKIVNDDKKVEGILERFSVITDDRIWQKILNKPCDYSNSFVDIMDKGESIVFLMPEDEGFTNKIIKSVFVTYIYSRIMLAMSMRKNHNQQSIIVLDELHQIPQTQSLIVDKIAEIRKFGIALLFSCHYLTQLTKELQDAIMNVNSNHMLLAGVGENCVKNLKHLFGDEFEEEDVYGLESFTSFNIFNIDNKRYQFITNLPPKIKGLNM